MLQDNIKSDLKKAMKAGDKQTVSCLRMLISAFKNKEISLRRDLSDEETLAEIRTQLKQTKDSFEQFSAGHRDDLAKQEELNLAVLKSYLPAEMSEEELNTIIENVIAELQATKKDFGKVMKQVMARVSGRADGKKVSSSVGKLLK